MPPRVDCYVLVASRSKKLVIDFLDRFLPDRRPLADEFEVPQYATTPEAVFESVDDLLAMLEARPTEGHALYWANTGSRPPEGALVAHTTDGKIVFGLSVNEDDEDVAAEYLARMRSFFGGDPPAYVAWEDPPQTSSPEFLVREAELRASRPPQRPGG